MTAQIIMVVWDTPENKRDEYTEKTLLCLLDTVDFRKHRLFISDNGSYEPTQVLYVKFKRKFLAKGFPAEHLTIHKNGSNIGCSNAINVGLRARKEGEACIKLDGDMIIHSRGWADEMCEVIERDDSWGIIGLKRFDLDNHPDQNQEEHNNEIFKTELVMLSHKKGQPHIVVEQCRDIIGSVTLFSPKLINAVGASIQPFLYGFEDVLYSLRSVLAGFRNGFLPHIRVSHIDRGDSSYTQEKMQEAHENWEKYNQMHYEFLNGTRPFYIEL